METFFHCFKHIGIFVVNERVSDLTQILILTLSVFGGFEKLQEEWKKFKWEIDELNWICFGMLDPSNFKYYQIAYLDHGKTCFYLKHNNY